MTSPLEADKEYYYEFELTDRYGAELKVEYEDGADGSSRYEGDKKPANLITGKDSDRQAYTCKQHPTGKLTMGNASYDSQTVSISLSNPNLSTVKDLYMTVQDSYGRYIGHSYDTATQNITGSMVSTPVTAEGQAQIRYMLMNGVTDAEGNTYG